MRTVDNNKTPFAHSPIEQPSRYQKVMAKFYSSGIYKAITKIASFLIRKGPHEDVVPYSSRESKTPSFSVISANNITFPTPTEIEGADISQLMDMQSVLKNLRTDVNTIRVARTLLSVRTTRSDEALDKDIALEKYDIDEARLQSTIELLEKKIGQLQLVDQVVRFCQGAPVNEKKLMGQLMVLRDDVKASIFDAVRQEFEYKPDLQSKALDIERMLKIGTAPKAFKAVLTDLALLDFGYDLKTSVSSYDLFHLIVDRRARQDLQVEKLDLLQANKIVLNRDHNYPLSPASKAWIAGELQLIDKEEKLLKHERETGQKDPLLDQKEQLLGVKRKFFEVVRDITNKNQFLNDDEQRQIRALNIDLIRREEALVQAERYQLKAERNTPETKSLKDAAEKLDRQPLVLHTLIEEWLSGKSTDFEILDSRAQAFALVRYLRQNQAPISEAKREEIIKILTTDDPKWPKQDLNSLLSN